MNATNASSDLSCVLAPNSRCAFWSTVARRWQLDGVVVEETDNHTLCQFDHLTDFASFIGPPVEASTLASLRDTFDLSAFASLNPLGLAVSLLLMVMLIAAAVRSARVHARTHGVQQRLFVKKVAVVKAEKVLQAMSVLMQKPMVLLVKHFRK